MTPGILRLEEIATQRRSEVAHVRRRMTIAVIAAGVMAGTVMLLAGAVILFGWEFGIARFRTLWPDYAGMALSTSSVLFACGLAVFGRSFFVRDRRCAACLIIGVIVSGVAIVNLGLQLVGQTQGIERLLRPDMPDASKTYMSAATAACALLAGICVTIDADRGNRRLEGPYSFAATAGLVVASVALVGYLYDVRTLYRIDLFSAMALHTAIGFAVLFAALHLARPNWGWMRAVVAAGPGSEGLRIMLPGIVAVPLFFTWLALNSVSTAERTADGGGGENIVLALLALASAGVLLIVLFGTTMRLNRQMAEHKLMSRRLGRALADRDILLSEVHHRVKNNLQFIDAMLAVEAGNLLDRDAVETIGKIRSRVYSLNRVHSRMIGSPDLDTIDLSDFLMDVCVDLGKGTAAAEKGIRLDVSVERTPVHWEQAIAIALLVTELVTNAIKHAFPQDAPGRRGVVSVTATNDGSAIKLRVTDDGIGRLEDDVRSGTVGTMIVDSLVRQLAATMDASYINGTEVVVTIPVPAEREGS